MYWPPRSLDLTIIEAAWELKVANIQSRALRSLVNSSCRLLKLQESLAKTVQAVIRCSIIRIIILLSN